MGSVARVKRAKNGKTRSKYNDSESDDSDEDYRVEEDEDYVVDEYEEQLYFNEEEEDEDDGDRDISDSFSNDDKLEVEDSREEGVMSKTIRSTYDRGLVQEKLSTREPNNRRYAQRRLVVSSDDDDLMEKLEVSEEDEDMTLADNSKHKRVCLERKKLHTNTSDNRRNQCREIKDKDYDVDVNAEDDEDQKETFQVSVEEELNGVSGTTSMSCLEQKMVHTKASNIMRNGHAEIDDEDYCIDEEEEEEEDDDDDEYTDEEYVNLEEEEFDEEEELDFKEVRQASKTSRRMLRNRPPVSRNKSKRTVRVANQKVGKKRKRSFNSRRKLGSKDSEGCNDFEDKGSSNNKQDRRGRPTKKPRRGRRNFTVQSDSEFLDSAQSDAEFSTSEEEGQEVREASKICRGFDIHLRSSGSKEIRETVSVAQRKPFARKGKKKIQEAGNEIVKHVCGICFSEEGKSTVRGTLNCCNHYFCYKCILEWSKVESRCPLCKDRFWTISKPAEANTGTGLRDVVFQVPERNQVYQPTEEEIRGYFDPYENVMCIECHEGGDDDLMLLCDLCDSPAHTYCVGLGRVVPEGNWYCEGCRPVSLGAASTQAWDSLTGQRYLYHGLSSFDGIGDNVDGSLSAQNRHGYGGLPSPRYISGGIQAHTPRSGTGVVTVSGRRQIHRHMQSLFSANNRIRQAEALFAISPSYLQANQNHSIQRTSPTIRIPVISDSLYNNWIEGSHDLPPAQDIHYIPVNSNHIEPQMAGPFPMPGDSSNQRRFIPSNILRHDQPFHLNNTGNVGFSNHLSSSTLEEGSNFFIEEQVKPLVLGYLTSMSINSSLDAGTVEEITRKCIHTVLAACGYQHHPNEVYPMLPRPPCIHIEYSSMHGSPINDCCRSCFANFVKEVVKTILNSKLPSFLQIRN